MRSRRTPLQLAEESRLLVPVLGSRGGVGRSTVAGLLAAALSRAGRTLLVDAVEHVGSPWKDWVDQPGAGVRSISEPCHPRAGEVTAACSTVDVGEGRPLSVLTDTAEVKLSPPLLLEQSPRSCLPLIAAGGHRLAVIDTDLPALSELAAARESGDSTPTSDWLRERTAVPVLCVPTSGAGLESALLFVTLVDALGLCARRVVIALTGIAPGRPPRRAKASLALLDGRVGPVVSVPHDPRIRAVGLHEMHKLSAHTRSAGDALARAVLEVAAEVGRIPTALPTTRPEEGGNSDAPAIAYDSAAR